MGDSKLPNSFHGLQHKVGHVRVVQLTVQKESGTGGGEGGGQEPVFPSGAVIRQPQGIQRLLQEISPLVRNRVRLRERKC